MKILLIHNAYGKYSGEEAVVDAQVSLLRKAGHDVRMYNRSSAELEEMHFGRARAFFTAFHNQRSIREIRKVLADFSPDVVHIHNLYPLISPAVLPEISKTGIPVVMTVHNYRLVCPNGLFFTHGEVCERCEGHKEWNCIIHNCEYNIIKSKGYALRNMWARLKRHYLDHVDIYLCLTDFQRKKLNQYGIPSGRCRVLPNFSGPQTPDDGLQSAVRGPQSPFLFAGRLNAQKGFDLLASAASINREVRIVAAGEPDQRFLSGIDLPGNLECPGKIPGSGMSTCFREAKALVFTSRSYEGFPMVFLEAMQHRLPVIAPRMAAFPEIIEDGINGLLFEPGNANDLAEKIRILNSNPDLCSRLGTAGYEKLKSEYSPEKYLKGLMDAYELAMKSAKSA